ncbi:MAG: hypothetical protein HZB82_02585 [Deltaproteobacteria bacterium]|nr:hypothetical protein [Deltaproteobacteria bacterium]
MAFLSACGGGAFTQVTTDGRESYRAAALNKEFKADGMALLTATGGGTENKKLLGDIVEDVLKAERPDLHIIPYWKNLSIINMNGLTADYAGMLKEYESTGILNRDALKKLKDAVGVMYFLQPRLVSFEQSQSNRFSFLGLSLVKTHESRIKVYLELWNAATGEIIWIGVGDATVATENYRARPVPFETAARYAVEKIAAKIP